LTFEWDLVTYDRWLLLDVRALAETRCYWKAVENPDWELEQAKGDKSYKSQQAKGDKSYKSQQAKGDKSYKSQQAKGDK
jgi:hypothetical protein